MLASRNTCPFRARNH